MKVALILLVACGGGGSGSGDDVATPDATKPTHSGYVSIQSYDAMNVPGTPTRGGSAGAGFFTMGEACQVSQTIGPCEVANCGAAATGAVSAGTITITGALEPISLVPGSDHTYAQLMSTTSLFNGGESITFAASGAEVPAFTKSLTMPSKATITAPAKPPSASPYLIVNRAQDFSVSWSGGGSGLVQIALNSQSADQRLFCRFTASAGTGKLPAAALATLPAGMGGFAMASIGDTEQDAGDWAVAVSAYFNAVWPDSAIVSGPTMFQ